MADASPGKSSATRFSPAITFAVAALNEQELIADFVGEAHLVASSKLDKFEFILIDDGSTDDTGQIMDRLADSLANTTVIHNGENLGLGRSYKRALDVAQHDYFMLLCGDGGFPAESLPAVLDEVGTADMVIPAITNLKELKSPSRYVISRAYTTILNTAFGLDIGYYNGLPVHRVDLLRSVAIANDGFGFQAEIIIKLIRAGHSYAQVPVAGAERSGGSRALRTRNLAGVVKMFLSLIRQTRKESD